MIRTIAISVARLASDVLPQPLNLPKKRDPNMFKITLSHSNYFEAVLALTMASNDSSSGDQHQTSDEDLIVQFLL